jgi:ribonuclease BN (tRNA processing enzyme)
MLIDCGVTSPVALQRRDVAQSELTHLVISHLHGDHFGGVPFLLLDARYNQPRASVLPIAGPPSVERRIVDTLELLFPGTSQRVLPRVPHRFVELPHRVRTEIDGVAVTPFEVVHPSGAPAYALRVEIAGRTIAYSGDTEWTPSLIDAADGADVFICECFGWETDVPSHLSHRVLCAHAHELRCKRMMLTHLGPEMLAHIGESRWPCASDGLVMSL